MLSSTRFHPQPHPLAMPRKPQGVITRGKTAPNRLRRVDNFLLNYDPVLLHRTDGAYANALFVDLGYGAEPVTTLESAHRLRQHNPNLPVLGVEIDAERVAAAQPYANDRTFFRLGGFNLPLKSWPDGSPETVRLIRAFNVLRQYDEAEVADAYTRLAQYVLPGGLMIEGTSDPFGRIWTANILRKAKHSEGWHHESLVFSTNFRTGFDPTEFQTRLPKNLIHHVVLGQPIYQFFQAWRQAALETQAVKVWGLRQWFMATAENLAARGYSVNLRRKWLSKGWLIWKNPLA